MCIFHMEIWISGFTLFEDRALWSHCPALLIWAGGEGKLCLVPNLPHLQTFFLTLCCHCLALGHWILMAWFRPAQLTDMETGSPFSTY